MGVLDGCCRQERPNATEMDFYPWRDACRHPNQSLRVDLVLWQTDPTGSYEEYMEIGRNLEQHGHSSSTGKPRAGSPPHHPCVGMDRVQHSLSQPSLTSQP